MAAKGHSFRLSKGATGVRSATVAGRPRRPTTSGSGSTKSDSAAAPTGAEPGLGPGSAHGAERSQTPFPLTGSSTRFPAVVAPAERAIFRVIRRRATQLARAYSSIGQSPRLITGPFLVRTQVGPPRFSSRPCFDHG